MESFVLQDGIVLKIKYEDSDHLVLCGKKDKIEVLLNNYIRFKEELNENLDKDICEYVNSYDSAYKGYLLEKLLSKIVNEINIIRKKNEE